MTTLGSSEIPPTLAEWRPLYDIALKVKELAPWAWMWDSDDFAVKDPETGTIGYCTVTGRLGEFFSVATHLGFEGLGGLLWLRSRKQSPDFAEFMQTQLLLRVAFEGRGQLAREDFKVIAELGLKFCGRNAWPQFRSFRPGHLPWFLTGAEARFLTLVLEQTMAVALRCKENPKLLEGPHEQSFLLRTPQREANGLVWRDEWHEPGPVVVVTEPTLPDSGSVDPVLLARARNAVRQRTGTWEIDIFPMPASVGGPGERPYFPFAFQVLDHETGVAFGVHVAAPAQAVGEFRNQFVRTIEKLQAAPHTIYVSNARTLELLEPICRELGITLCPVKSLPRIREYRRAMERFFEDGPGAV